MGLFFSEVSHIAAPWWWRRRAIRSGAAWLAGERAARGAAVPEEHGAREVREELARAAPRVVGVARGPPATARLAQGSTQLSAMDSAPQRLALW